MVPFSVSTESGSKKFTRISLTLSDYIEYEHDIVPIDGGLNYFTWHQFDLITFTCAKYAFLFL